MKKSWSSSNFIPVNYLHMKILSQQEIRQRQLDILKEFRKVCEQENLQYSIYAGTLIGALRHKGYIPWDDDIDVALSRKDYERLLAVWQTASHSPHMQLYDSRVISKYDYPFIKIVDTRTVCRGSGKENPKIELGIHIDVFAIDGMPKNRCMALMLCKLMRVLRHCCEMSRLTVNVAGRSLWKRILILAFKICTLGASSYFWHRVANFIASRYDLSKSRWAGNLVWGHGTRELVPVECYDGRQKVIFEDEMYDAFGGSDTYLRTVYGDYMVPPPPEQQVGIHIVEAYEK